MQLLLDSSCGIFPVQFVISILFLHKSGEPYTEALVFCLIIKETKWTKRKGELQALFLFSPLFL